jgi:hypothetical protein
VGESADGTAGLEARLRRWVTAELITQDQADAIRRHEGMEGPVPHLPVPAEAVADIGIVLGLAAGGVLWSRFAGDGRDGARLALSAGVTVGLLVGGALLRRADEAGFQRIASVLWFAATLAIGVTVTDVYALSAGRQLPAVTTLGAGVPMLAMGWITHAVDRRAPTMLGAFAGSVTTAVGLVVWLAEDATEDARLTMLSLTLGAVGIAWLAAGLVGWITPRDRAGVLGAGALLVAPLFLLDQATGAALLLGVATSAALMAIGVRLAGTATLIAGAIGLFGYLTGTLVHFFQDSLGVPLVLLLAGVLMIAIAAATVRLRRSRAAPSTP